MGRWGIPKDTTFASFFEVNIFFRPSATLKTLKTPVLRVLRVPIHDPFLDQPPQWGFS